MGAYFPSPFFANRGHARRESDHPEEDRKWESKQSVEGEFSTGVGDGGHRFCQAQSPKQEQIDGGMQWVRAAMETTDSIKPFDGEGQAGQQPDCQPAGALMVAEVLKALVVLSPGQ